MKKVFLILPLLIAGCAVTPDPEPVVRTITVEVPVLTSCVPDNLGPKPSYPDTDEALLSAPGPAERMLLMFQGRTARNNRLTEVEIALENCNGRENER